MTAPWTVPTSAYSVWDMPKDAAEVKAVARAAELSKSASPKRAAPDTPSADASMGSPLDIPPEQEDAVMPPIAEEADDKGPPKGPLAIDKDAWTLPLLNLHRVLLRHMRYDLSIGYGPATAVEGKMASAATIKQVTLACPCMPQDLVTSDYEAVMQTNPAIWHWQEDPSGGPTLYGIRPNWWDSIDYSSVEHD